MRCTSIELAAVCIISGLTSRVHNRPFVLIRRGFFRVSRRRLLLALLPSHPRWKRGFAVPREMFTSRCTPWFILDLSQRLASSWQDRFLADPFARYPPLFPRIITELVGLFFTPNLSFVYIGFLSARRWKRLIWEKFMNCVLVSFEIIVNVNRILIFGISIPFGNDENLEIFGIKSRFARGKNRLNRKVWRYSQICMYSKGG